MVLTETERERERERKEERKNERKVPMSYFSDSSIVADMAQSFGTEDRRSGALPGMLNIHVRPEGISCDRLYWITNKILHGQS